MRFLSPIAPRTPNVYLYNCLMDFFVEIFQTALESFIFGNFPDNHPDWCTKLTLGVFLCICISVFIFVFLLLHKRVDCSKRFLLPIAPRAPIAAEPSLAVDPIDLHGFWF